MYVRPWILGFFPRRRRPAVKALTEWQAVFIISWFGMMCNMGLQGT